MFSIGKWHFLFHAQGVFTAGSKSSYLSVAAAGESDPQLVWSLIDSDSLDGNPPPEVLGVNVFPIQATFPDLKKYDKWKEVGAFLLQNLNDK